ncbi:MAG: HAD family hydrolase [Candidatus Dormibacteria bacterium]
MTQQQATSEPVTETREFDGVIFDLGGVMTEPLFHHRTDVPPEFFSVIAFFLGEFRDHYHLTTGVHDLHLLELGRISEDEFFDRMIARYNGAGNEPVDARVAQQVIFGRGMVACGAMADAVRQIRDAGYRTALLTNISRQGEEIFTKLFAVDELFDIVVDSSKVGMRKPDPEIYRLTCTRLGVVPERCLFIDDLLCNVEAADALGMQTIQCLDPVAVADEVVRRLLGHPAAAEAGAEA